MPTDSEAPTCAAPDPDTKQPRRRPPALACDAHMHICGPASRFAYAPKRIYTPPDALLPEYLKLAGILGLQRVVFVQPSVHVTDNSAMLAAMKECPLPNRGVAVVSDGVTDDELRVLHERGIRGVRFNLV